MYLYTGNEIIFFTLITIPIFFLKKYPFPKVNSIYFAFNMKKLLFSIVTILLPLSLFPQELVRVSILIDAPKSQIFQYLGNSNNSQEWSSYVDTIYTLNPTRFKDGQVGSIRRCIVNKKQWDEKILEVIPNEKRLLYCYNFKNFILNPPLLYTEQLYESVGDKTLLTFTILTETHKFSFFEKKKLYFGVFQSKRIFKKNLKNIKKLNNTKST